MSACCRLLQAFRDPRIEVCPFGLWKETCDLQVFDPGGLGATVFADDKEGHASETCPFVEASGWFRQHILPGDQVFMKFNCEGSECDIVETLLASGEIRKVHNFMIDFDAYKFPSQRHRPREILRRLDAMGINNYMLHSEAMIGPTHVARIQNWLRLAHGSEPLPSSFGNDLRYIYGPLAGHYAGEAARFFHPRSLARRLLPPGAHARLRDVWRAVFPVERK